MSAVQRLAPRRKRIEADHHFAVRLLEHLVVPTFVLDQGGRVMIWNRACERLTGLLAHEVLGTSDHWRGFYDEPRPCLADLVPAGMPDGFQAPYEKFAHAGSDEGRLSAENWCVMPRLGARRYLAIDAGPIYAETGALVAVVETLRDITVQKEAQLALEALASRDGLTGLANRCLFDAYLEQECQQSQRTGMPLSLLMIDIDHFKPFNDAVGHQRGDACLRQIASLIASEVLRPGDLAARYGGEEFAVILPSTTLDGALVVANRILIAVTMRALPHPASTRARIVTLSIGAACWAHSGPAEPAALIGQADAALYRAKHEGRNQVAATKGLS